MTEYWFARYRPGANPGRGIVPLSWKGRVVLGGFIAGMIIGALLFLMFGLRDQIFAGIACFAICALAGAGTFLWASVCKTDPVKSVADYREGGR